MAGSIIAAFPAYVKLTVLAIWRNWGNYLHRGAFWPISAKQIVKHWKTRLCKRTSFPGVLDNRDLVIKTLSVPELSASLWQ